MWQTEEGLGQVALELVFGWLTGTELARAGAVCRVWREAARAPHLWRRLVATEFPLSPRGQSALRHLHGAAAWRQLYVEACAGWEAVGLKLQPSPYACGGMQHAALSPRGERLALLTSDATVSIWERNRSAPERWVERWNTCLSGRGWESAARGEWGGEGRLLVMGPRALLRHDSWELLVIHVDEECVGALGARARAGAGAAGCWADSQGSAFLSFELRLLAPALAATTVWLNAATQETQSEYAGVTTPLLRIFNEDGHITRALVAEVPVDDREDGSDEFDDDAAYVRATRSEGATTQLRVLICTWGRDRGAVGAWALDVSRPPPLLAAEAGDLRVRLARRRAARLAPPPEQAEPSEAQVRALCTPPVALCPLPGAPTGVVVHPNGRCVWACWSGGYGACLSLPTLLPLRALSSDAAPSPTLDHYSQPAVSPAHFAAPVGGMSGAVCVWSVALKRPPTALRHCSAALAALLPPPLDADRDTRRHERATLLVLTSDCMHVWRSKATLQQCFESG